MLLNRYLYYLTSSLLLLTQLGYSQGKLDDYKRAISLDTLFRNKTYNDPYAIKWLPDYKIFWYINTVKGGHEYMIVDAETNTQKLAFDHEKVAEKLTKLLGKPFDAKNLDLKNFQIDGKQSAISYTIDSASIRTNLNSDNYETDIAEIKVEKKRDRRYWGAGRNETDLEFVNSPDDNWKAYIEEHNVYVDNLKTGEKSQLSYDGTAGCFYSSYMQWSPDSKKLMAYKYTPSEDSKIYFVESSPTHQLQPVLHTRDYLKPGDMVAQKSPQLFLVDEMKHVEIDDAGIQDQFSLGSIRWREDSKAFTFEYNQRGHQNYKVIEVDEKGASRTLIHEHSDTFIDYSGKKFRHDVENTNEIIWASERDGWNHLYLFDSKTGAVKNQITIGEWVVRDVVHVDDEAREIIFTASGMNKGQDPYFIHYYKIGFDGKNLVKLTKEDGNHQAWFSEDYSMFVDKYSKIDEPSTTVLRNSKNGKIEMELQKANISDLLKTGWKAPEVFTSKARDNETDIWGIIVRPTNFDPNKTYPVIEYIYAGPHSSFVPKDFRPYLWSMHSIAELGFIVVQLDGMGTSNRSKAFHDVCYQNLKDAGFPDRKLWIKAAAKKYPYMDAENVGIFGTSAGGQSSTGALVFNSDFYDVAVSSCGCHDNRMDKIWWNEQWMGKIGPHYAASSNVVNAHQMQGNLMLILGEVDDNVDPASTMQLADALIKSNKEFELVVIPGYNHTSGGEYGERKRKDFFVKHLLHVDPPTWDLIYEDKKLEK
ncbi:DPP IV N-terminal domain-containing protein [Chondrinema litorale]|uniref:DPP IV N-terminal domain-containing protein n=1 Tax=Chondrinema litorale TaxID=2994555 RepID=UPI002542FB86|nr:DPP IV N-terminal domain-containing protein [Chondrinema litorale]UZR96082.1 DPP IV N-terminal domain-containing protein [Chondrinema litorale]